MQSNDKELVGIFVHLDSLVESVKKLQKMDIKDFVVYSPFPNHEIQELLGKRPSPVRFYTLIGALVGFFGGFGLAAFTALKWGLITGGKPLISIPPFIVVSFEITVLLAALATIAGLIGNAWLSRRRRYAYDSRFSQDHFGLALRCPDHRLPRIREMLNSSGVTEILTKDHKELPR